MPFHYEHKRRCAPRLIAPVKYPYISPHCRRDYGHFTSYSLAGRVEAP